MMFDVDNPHTATIVTAYFNVPSRHSHQHYMQWITNCLSFGDNMVIFTEPQFIK